MNSTKSTYTALSSKLTLSSKTSTAAGKGRIAAKKIQNIDLDTLTLQEDTNSWKPERSSFETLDTIGSVDAAIPSRGLDSKEDVEEVQGSSKPTTGMSDEERLRKFKNAKSISSSSFQNTDGEGFDAGSKAKFANATAISSSQYFGDNNGGSKVDYQQSKKIE